MSEGYGWVFLACPRRFGGEGGRAHAFGTHIHSALTYGTYGTVLHGMPPSDE